MLLVETVFLLVISNIDCSTISKIQETPYLAKEFATKIAQNSQILFVGKKNGYFRSLVRNTTETHLSFRNHYLKVSYQCNILHLNEIEQFRETLIDLQKLEIFGTRRIYICIIENIAYIQKLIDLLWQFNIYKSVVILENRENFNFFQADYKNCGKNIGVKELKSRKELLKAFELKMEQSFRNCQLEIAYATIVPWIYTQNGEKFGLLVDFLKLVTEKDQFNLTFLAHDYEDDISNSFNFDALYQDFEDGKGDIFVGLVNFYPALYFDVTNSLIDDSIIFVIPKGQKMPYWKAMMHIYSLNSWVLTLFLFIVFFSILCLVGYFSRDRSFRYPAKNLIFVYAVFLGMSVPKKLDSKLIKFLFLTMFLICTINSIVIQGKLYSIFSVPVFERDINDIESLLQSRLPIKFREGISLIFSDQKKESKEILRVYIPTNKTLRETADELAKTKDFATLVDQVQLIAKPSLGQLVTSIELVNFQIVYLFKKHHHLFERLNFQVERCIESGFMDYLLSIFKWYRLLEDEDLKKSHKAFKLTLEHLQGPFFIFLAGILLSTLTFLVELILHRIMKF